MPSEKFRKLLRDTSKLKEAKKICENAGYKVRSNSINESESDLEKLTNINIIDSIIKENFKYLSADASDEDYGSALCNIIEGCACGFKYFSREYFEETNPERAHILAHDVSNKINYIKNVVRDLQNIIDEL